MRIGIWLVIAVTVWAPFARGQTLGTVLTAIQNRNRLYWLAGGASLADVQLIQWPGLSADPSDAEANGLSVKDKLKLLRFAWEEVDSMAQSNYYDVNKIKDGTGILANIGFGSPDDRILEENFAEVLKLLAQRVSRLKMIQVSSSNDTDGIVTWEKTSGNNLVKESLESPVAFTGDSTQQYYRNPFKLVVYGGAYENNEIDPPIPYTEWEYGYASYFPDKIKVKGLNFVAGTIRGFTNFFYQVNLISSDGVSDSEFYDAGNHQWLNVPTSNPAQIEVDVPHMYASGFSDLKMAGHWVGNVNEFHYYVLDPGQQDFWDEVYDIGLQASNRVLADLFANGPWDLDYLADQETGIFLDYSFYFTANFTDLNLPKPPPEKAPELVIEPDLANRCLRLRLARLPQNECELVWLFPRQVVQGTALTQEEKTNYGYYRAWYIGGAGIAARAALAVRGSGDWDAVYSGKTADREPELAWPGGPFDSYARWSNFFSYLREYWQPVLTQLVTATYALDIRQPNSTERFKYFIDVYRRDQVGSKNLTTKRYAFNGSPIGTYTVENPTGNDAQGGRLRITTPEGAVYDVTLDSQTLTPVDPNSLWTNYIDSTWKLKVTQGVGGLELLNQTVAVEEERRNSSGAVTKYFTVTESDRRMDGRALPSITTTYYEGWANPKRIKTVTETGTDGTRTTAYAYQDKTDPYGNTSIDYLSGITQSGGPNPYTASFNDAEQLIDWQSGSWAVHVDYSGSVVTRTTKFGGTPVSTEATAYSPDMTAATTTVSGAADTQKVVERYPANDTVNPWRLKRVRDYDGSLTTWAYSWPTTATFKTVESTTGNSATTAPSVTAGTRTETTVNAAGWMTSRNVYSIEGGGLVDSLSATGTQAGTPFPNAFAHLFGPAESFAYDGQGRVTSHTDQWGKTTNYTRDGLGRITQAVRSPVTWTIAYNPGDLAAGSLGRRITAAAAGATTRTWTEQASPFGASASWAQTGPENVTVTRSDSGTTVTTTETNSTTNRSVTTAVTKGTLATAMSGNATEPWNITYTFPGSTSQGWKVTTTHTGVGALTGSVTSDALGRIRQRVIPGYTGTGTATTSFAYTDGLLSGTSEPAGATTYAYRPDGALKTVAFGGRSLTLDRTSSTGSQITWQWTNGAGEVLLKRVYTAATGVTEDQPRGDAARMVTTTPTLSGGVLTQTITGAAGTGISGSASWSDGVPTAGSYINAAFRQDWAATPNAFGDITSLTINPGGLGTSNFTTTYNDQGLPTNISAVAGLGATTFPGTGYDGSGNLTLKATRDNKTILEQTTSAKGYPLYEGGYGRVSGQWGSPELGSITTWTVTSGSLIQKIKVNAAGQPMGGTFANTSTESFTRTGAGLLNGWTRPGGSVPATGNAFGQTTSLGSVGPIDYDGAGRVRAATDPGGSHTLGYVLGQLGTESHDGGPLSGQSVKREYDKGRLTKVTISPGTMIQYAYDTSGKLTGVTTAGGLTGTWSNHDPVTGKAKALSFPGKMTVAANYDGKGRPTSWASTPAGSGVQTYSYGYNASGRCTSWSTPGGNWTSLSYDSNGFLQNATRAGGPAIVYTNDAQGRLTAISWNGTSQATNGFNGFLPTIRANRNTVEVTGTVSTSPAATVTINGTSVPVTGGAFSQTYTQTPNTWQAYTVRGTITGGGYNNANRVAEETRDVFIPPASESLSFNANGARTGDAQWDYTISNVDKLTSALEKTTPSGVLPRTISYAYDWMGRMVERKVVRNGALIGRTTFLYDGSKPVREQEFDIQGWKATRVYTWGPDVSGDFDGAAGIGGLLEMFETRRGGTSATSLAINDGIGNVVGWVDATTGKQVAAYAYGPYGEQLSTTGERAESCPLRWQSKFYDSDLKVSVFRDRVLDSRTLTWLSNDPEGMAGGKNLVQYAFGQPLNYCDPNGGKPQLFSQIGSSNIGNTARVVGGVPQVHYSDYANWWSPLTDGATTDWWQSPTDDELARLFRPTAGGYRLAGVDERSAVWDQQMAAALPAAMQNAQASFGAFAQLSGGGIAAASGVGALAMGGAGGLVLAGHEFYAAGSNWLGAANGTSYPVTPEGLLAQSGGASNGVVTGVDLAAFPLVGSLRFGSAALPRGIPIKFHYTTYPESSFAGGLRRQTSVTDKLYTDPVLAGQELGIPTPTRIIPILDRGHFIPNRPFFVEQTLKYPVGGGTDFYNVNKVPPSDILPGLTFDKL